MSGNGEVPVTEYEIVYLTSEYINRTWSVMQFWASVSFGLIALSHLGQRHLNFFATLIVSVLYLGFTLFVMNILRINGVVVSGFLNDLEALKGEDGSMGAGALAIMETAPGTLELAAIVTTFWGLFVGSLIFLWVSYIHFRKNNAKGAL